MLICRTWKPKVYHNHPFDVYLNLKGSQGIGESKLTVEYFEEGTQRLPQQPAFILDQERFPTFMEQTGQWVHEKFEEVLTNIISGKYLTEQEMS